ASLAGGAVARDARRLIDFFAVTHVGGTGGSGNRGGTAAGRAAESRCSAARCSRLCQRGNLAVQGEHPDAIAPLAVGEKTATGVDRDVLLTVVLECRDRGVHARIGGEFPEAVAVGLVECSESAVRPADEQ